MSKRFPLRGGMSDQLGAIALALAVIAGVAGSAAPTRASAEARTVRVAIQPGATYLPMLMIQHHKLVEKHAQQAGLGTITTTWVMLGSGAVRVYLAESKDKEPEESLLKMLSSPDVAFTAVPHNTMGFADFMFRRRLIPVRPQSWKDLFFSEIHDRAGS